MVDRHVTHAQQMVFTYGRMRTSDDLDANGMAANSEGEAAHILNGMCWCQPMMETDLVSGNRLFIHRRNLDEFHVKQLD